MAVVDLHQVLPVDYPHHAIVRVDHGQVPQAFGTKVAEGAHSGNGSGCARSLTRARRMRSRDVRFRPPRFSLPRARPPQFVAFHHTASERAGAQGVAKGGGRGKADLGGEFGRGNAAVGNALESGRPGAGKPRFSPVLSVFHTAFLNVFRFSFLFPLFLLKSQASWSCVAPAAGEARWRARGTPPHPLPPARTPPPRWQRSSHARVRPRARARHACMCATAARCWSCARFRVEEACAARHSALAALVEAHSIAAAC